MTTQSFRCQPDCPLISVSEAWHLVESLVCALKRLPSCMTKVPPIPGFLWAHGLRPWHDPRVGHLPVSWFENGMSNLLYPSSFDSYPRQNCRFLNDGCDIRHVRMCMLPPTCSLFCQRQMVLPNENVALCFFLLPLWTMDLQALWQRRLADFFQELGCHVEDFKDSKLYVHTDFVLCILDSPEASQTFHLNFPLCRTGKHFTGVLRNLKVNADLVAIIVSEILKSLLKSELLPNGMVGLPWFSQSHILPHIDQGSWRRTDANFTFLRRFYKHWWRLLKMVWISQSRSPPAGLTAWPGWWHAFLEPPGFVSCPGYHGGLHSNTDAFGVPDTSDTDFLGTNQV